MHKMEDTKGKQSDMKDCTPFELIKHLEEAARRPLLTEIAGRKRKLSVKKVEQEDETPSWLDLMKQATRCAPFMTEEEHGRVMHLVSILLLGFLVPDSTGNDFPLLQSCPFEQDFDPVKYVLDLPLEKRLSLLDRGGIENLQDHDTVPFPPVDDAFTDFLLDGLKPLLSARPAHRESVDIIHLLAMIIHPLPTIFPHFIEGRESWKVTECLLESRAAHYFYVNYETRLMVAKIVEESLSVPSLSELRVDLNVYLLYRSIPHLLASLQAFRQTARSDWDAQVAYAASISVAVQTENSKILLSVWDDLLQLMAQDREKCFCASDSRCPSEDSKRKYTLISSDVDACRHRERSLALKEFILRCGMSRMYKDRRFYEHLVVSIADVLDTEYESWLKPSKDRMETESETPAGSPCLLSGILCVASATFVLLDSPDEVSEDDPYDTMMHHATELLAHPVARIRDSSAYFLIKAIDETNRKTSDRYADLVYDRLSAIAAHDKEAKAMQLLIERMTTKSKAFATLIVEDFFLRNRDTIPLSWLVSVSRSAPRILAKCRKEIHELTRETPDQCQKSSLLASIVSLRAEQFFGWDEGDVALVNENLSGLGPWECYRLATHSICTGAFGIAATMLSSDIMLSRCGKECHYFWLTAMHRVASAEASLGEKKALGLPNAIALLEDATSYFDNLDSLWNGCNRTSFQQDYLRQRLDFLELLVTLRQLTSEMRLTGTGPKKSTRPSKMLRNLVRIFGILSKRFRHLATHYGAHFRFPRTFLCISVCSSLCNFVADTAAHIFADFLTMSYEKSFRSSKAKTLCHPMAEMIVNMQAVVEKIDGSVEAVSRAEALLQIIDGILMCPFPYSKDFFAMRPVEKVKIHFTSCDDEDEGIHPIDVIEAYPIVSFSFCVHGTIPQKLFEMSRVPFDTVLLWYRIRFEDHLQQSNDDTDTPMQQSPATMIERIPEITNSPVATRISRNGRFSMVVECPPIADEGYFRIDMKLGCRNVKGEEFHLESNPSTLTLQIHVARMR